MVKAGEHWECTCGWKGLGRKLTSHPSGAWGCPRCTTTEGLRPVEEFGSNHSCALTVWPPGATARLGDLGVTILGVMLRKGEVLYEVAWINNGDRKEIWVHGFELRAGSEEQRVGFRQGPEVIA